MPIQGLRESHTLSLSWIQMKVSIQSLKMSKVAKQDGGCPLTCGSQIPLIMSKLEPSLIFSIWFKKLCIPSFPTYSRRKKSQKKTQLGRRVCPLHLSLFLHFNNSFSEAHNQWPFLSLVVSQRVEIGLVNGQHQYCACFHSSTALCWLRPLRLCPSSAYTSLN